MCGVVPWAGPFPRRPRVPHPPCPLQGTVSPEPCPRPLSTGALPCARDPLRVPRFRRPRRDRGRDIGLFPTTPESCAPPASPRQISSRPPPLYLPPKNLDTTPFPATPSTPNPLCEPPRTRVHRSETTADPPPRAPPPTSRSVDNPDTPRRGSARFGRTVIIIADRRPPTLVHGKVGPLSERGTDSTLAPNRSRSHPRPQVAPSPLPLTEERRKLPTLPTCLQVP